MRLLCLALLALLFAPAAPAAVVSFTATYRVGYGDRGNPPTSPATNRNNALPACNGGYQASAASIPAAGFAELGAGPGPGSLQPIRGHFEKFQLGSAGPKSSMYPYAKPGVAGLNGAAEYLLSTCWFQDDPHSLWNNTVGHTHRSFFTAPADKEILATTTASGMRNFPRGPNDEVHTLVAGGGPGTFMVTVSAAPSRTLRLSGMAGPNRFGGGWRASGGGGIGSWGVQVGAGLTYIGSLLPSGPRMFGHGETPITQVVTRTGTFTNVPTGGMVPVQMKVWAMPFTTGAVWVRAESPPSTRVTTLQRTGHDNRNAAGTTGSLLLVSPWMANVGPPLNLSWGGTAELEFQFLPEPGPSALLGAGLIGLLALHARSRRRARAGSAWPIGSGGAAGSEVRE